jgi:hypothetical protein
MSWNTYFTGTEENIAVANNQIGQNLGLPFMGTERWADPQQAYQQDFWFILMPPPQGWTREDGTHFTQEQMIENVSNVDMKESSPDWWPPLYPPKGIKI